MNLNETLANLQRVFLGRGHFCRKGGGGYLAVLPTLRDCPHKFDHIFHRKKLIGILLFYVCLFLEGFLSYK